MTDEDNQAQLEAERLRGGGGSSVGLDATRSDPSLFALLDWQTEVLDLLLTLVAIAVPDEIAALLAQGFLEHLIAVLVLSNRLLARSKAKEETQSGRWEPTLSLSATSCVRIMLHLTRFQPSLFCSLHFRQRQELPPDPTSGVARSIHDLATRASRPFALQVRLSSWNHPPTFSTVPESPPPGTLSHTVPPCYITQV